MALTLLISGFLWLGILLLLRRRESRNQTFPLHSLDLAAGGILFLLTIGFFWRVISGDVYQPADGGDLVSFLFPTYRFAASQISQGVLPLWNPHLYGGAPFIGDIQAGFFYLPNLLLFLLNPTFAYTTLQWMAQLHIFWAGLGMYALVRSLRWQSWEPSRPAALFAAIAFQFSDPLLTHLGNLNLIAVLAWMPWILAAFQLSLRRKSLRWAAIAALLFAIANYAGHAQSSMYIGLALLISTIFWMLTESTTRSDSQKNSGFIARLLLPSASALPLLFATILLTALLTAPILLPAVELAQYTERADFSYQDTIAFSLAPTQAIGLITPGFFGRGPALHWSLWDRVETPYAGVATLLLAFAGLVLASAEQRRRLLPWLGVAVFGFVTALGVYAILHGWLTQLVPGFDQFRAPARALVLWTLGLSVLAAAGFDAFYQRSMVNAQWSIVNGFSRGGALLLWFIAVPLVYLALLLTQDNDTAFLRASVAALAIVAAAFFWVMPWLLLALRRADRIGANLFAVFMIGLLFTDFSAVGGAYTDISPTDPTSGYHHPEIVSFLKTDPDLFRIDTRTGIEQFWQPDAAALHGLQDVWGVANPLLLSHWNQLWESTGPPRSTALYDMLNVKYVLVEDGVPLPEGKFELALDAPGALSVYRNLAFMPRAWVVHDAKIAPDMAASIAEMQVEGFDPQQTVILQTPDEGLQLAGPTVAASAMILHYGSSEITIEANSPAPGYLVSSEVWYPGWRATVNGADGDILRANGALRAVAIPAGESIVEMRFVSDLWRWGLGALGLGMILLLVVFILLSRQK